MRIGKSSVQIWDEFPIGSCIKVQEEGYDDWVVVRKNTHCNDDRWALVDIIDHSRGESKLWVQAVLDKEQNFELYLPYYDRLERVPYMETPLAKVLWNLR